MADVDQRERSKRRWETVPEQYQDAAYAKWKERYRTVNVAMSPLEAAKDVQDGFPVDADGQRLSGFFDAGHEVEQLRQAHADSGMNDRGLRGLIAADLQRRYNERRQSLESALRFATGPDHVRLSLLGDAERASVEEHMGRLRDLPDADQRIEAAKDRFADLQAYDYAHNHPITNPDRDFEKAPLSDRERFNWLYGRDSEEDGKRQQPDRALYDQKEYEALMYNAQSSDRGVAIRQIEPLPRPANDVDVSVREAIRLDAAHAVEQQKQAEARAAERAKDMPPTFEPREFKEQAFQPEPDHRPRATDEGERFYRGTLKETGEALVRPDDPTSMSPYARLEGRNGENWKVFGIGVPKAIQSGKISVGDTLELRKMNIDEGGRWVAKPHDFEAHEEAQKVEHEAAQAVRKDGFTAAEAKRFETFKVAAEAWQARNPTEQQTLKGFSDMLDAPAVPRADAQDEPIARAATRAQRRLDEILGRVPKAEAPAQAQQNPAAAGEGMAAEVDRVRAERDLRLGLNQPAAAAPAQQDAHVQALTQHKSDQQVLADTLNAAGTTMRTGFTSDKQNVYFDFKVGGEAVNGHAAWNPETIELGKQQQPNAIDAFTSSNGGRLEQALGHPVNDETRSFMNDALHAYVERSAIDTIQRDGYVVGIPNLPDRNGLAAKLDARAAEVQQDEGKSQRQGDAGAVAVPGGAVEHQQAQPVVEQQAQQDAETPVQAPPVPKLANIGERLDARPAVEQPGQASAVTQEPVKPEVEVQAPVVAQAAQEQAAARPAVPNLANIGERVDARQTTEQPAQEPVKPEVEVQAPVVAQAAQEQAAARPAVPNLANIGERLDARPAIVQPAEAPAQAQEAVKPEVEVQAPVVAQAAQEQSAARPVVPNLPNIGERLDARPAIVQPADAQKVEQPAPAQAQPVAQPVADQPVNHQAPANVPDRAAFASKLNADVQAFNAEAIPGLNRLSSSIERMFATSRALEQTLASTQDVAPLEQLVAQSQAPSEGMRMRHRHSL